MAALKKYFAPGRTAIYKATTELKKEFEANSITLEHIVALSGELAGSEAALNAGKIVDSLLTLKPNQAAAAISILPALHTCIKNLLTIPSGSVQQQHVHAVTVILRKSCAILRMVRVSIDVGKLASA